MAWTDNIPAWGNQVSDDVGKIKDNFTAIKESFAGASAPTNPRPGQIWLDTATHLLKIRNEANNAWQNVWDVANNKPVLANLSGDITGTMISAAIKDAVAGTASLRTLGTGATQAMPGNMIPPLPPATAGTLIVASALLERTIYSLPWTKIKEIYIPRGGTYRIRFSMMRTDYAQSAGECCIYRNGSAVGTVRTTFETHTEDITGWQAGDLCQLYALAGSWAVRWICKDFIVSEAAPITPYVLLD